MNLLTVGTSKRGGRKKSTPAKHSTVATLSSAKCGQKKVSFEGLGRLVPMPAMDTRARLLLTLDGSLVKLAISPTWVFMLEM